MDSTSWFFLFVIALWALIYAWVIARRQSRHAAETEEKFEQVVKNLELVEQRLRALQFNEPPRTAAAAPRPDVQVHPQPAPLAQAAAAHAAASPYAPLVAPKPTEKPAPSVPVPAPPVSPAQSVAAPAPAQATCAKCGAVLMPAAVFCTRCGATVAVSKPASQPAVAKPPAAETVVRVTTPETKPATPPPPPPPLPVAKPPAATTQPPIAASAPPTAAQRPPVPQTAPAAPPPTPSKPAPPSAAPTFASVAKPVPKKPSRSFEEIVGTNWLPKLGAVILVVGVALLTARQWQHVTSWWHWIGPWGRDALILMGSLGLLFGGIKFESHDRYKNLGRSMIGGGWALTFLMAFVIRHAEPFKILPSDAADLAVLLVVAAVMVWHTLKYKSQTVTGLAFLLGFTAVTLNPDPPFNLVAGALLVTGMTVIVVRRQWFQLDLVGMLASYANHFYWLYNVYEQQGQRATFPHHTASVLLVIGYWVIFRASYLVRKISHKEQESLSTLAGLLNPILFLIVMKYQGFHPTWAWKFLLTMGAVEFTLGQISVARRRRAPFQLLSSLGVTLMLAAPVVRGSGNALEIIWLIGAEAFLLAGVLPFTRERLFRGFGLIISFLVALYALPVRIFPLAAQVSSGHAHHDAKISLVLTAIALALYANAHITRRLWPDLFEEALEDWSLSALSYIASLFAVAAIYASAPDHVIATLLAIFALWLCTTGKLFSIAEMIYQAHWVSAVAFIQVLVADSALETKWLGLPQRVLAFASVAGLLYLSSRFVRLSETRGNAMLAGAYSWAGTALLTLLIWFQFQTPGRTWAMPVLWIVLGLALSVVAQFFKRTDLKWQAFTLVLLSAGRALYANLAVASPLSSNPAAMLSHITYRLLSISLIAIGIYLLARWAPLARLRPVYTAIGTLLLSFLAYKEASQPWTALCWIGLALGLCGAALWFKQADLKWQAFVLVILSFARTLLVNFDLTEAFHSLTLRLISVSLTAAGIYLLARWAPLLQLRPVYTAIGTLLLSFLAYKEASQAWTALWWIGLALALSGAALWFKQADLTWQAFVLVVLSFARTLTANFDLPGTFHSLTLRLISVSLTAVGIYLLARWAPLSQIRPVYSVAGTFLFGYLAFKEAPAPWTAVLWTGLALVLCLAARWWKDRALLWQTHLLSLLAAGWTLYLFYDPQYRATRVQWITVAITAVVLYAFTWLTDIATVIEDHRICQAYAWAGSLLLSWLAWYQFPPISVSLVWGLFALLLFEFPDLAKAVKIDVSRWAISWRAQAYVALAGSFVHIFIANFNVIGWVSASVVVCLAAIYYFIYWELGRRQLSHLENSLYLEFLIAGLGTATLAALAYFELGADWRDAVVIGYAGLVVGTLLVAWLTRRQVFLFHSLVMLGVTAFRFSMTNFFDVQKQVPSSLSGSIWALALLACAVPLAFQVRKNAPAGNVPRWFRVLALHPEQPTFFVPVALSVVLLYLQVSGWKLTGDLAVEGLVVWVLALWAKERTFRLTGLALVLLGVGKILFWDVWQVHDAPRYIAFIAVGAIVMLLSFLYSKYSEALRDYL